MIRAQHRTSQPEHNTHDTRMDILSHARRHRREHSACRVLLASPCRRRRPSRRIGGPSTSDLHTPPTHAPFSRSPPPGSHQQRPHIIESTLYLPDTDCWPAQTHIIIPPIPPVLRQGTIQSIDPSPAHRSTKRAIHQIGRHHG